MVISEPAAISCNKWNGVMNKWKGVMRKWIVNQIRLGYGFLVSVK